MLINFINIDYALASRNIRRSQRSREAML